MVEDHGSRYMMTKKQRVFAPEEGTSVMRLENIACITNAGMSFWETGPRKLVQLVTSHGPGRHGRAVNDAKRGFLLEACWGINRYCMSIMHISAYSCCFFCIFWIVSKYLQIFNTFLLQECDYLTCEFFPACHRCSACKSDLLSTDQFPAKSTRKRKSEISKVARGGANQSRGLTHR